MVLFADSADPKFFTDDVLQVIAAACKGFVTNLEKLCATKTLIPIRSDYNGFPVETHDKVRDLEDKLEELGVTFDHGSFKAFKNDLTFDTIRTLDLEVGGMEGYFRELSPTS
jgi:hypothetical protein